MTTILLHRPVASHPDLERLHLFAGRHLGEDEFDQRQNYAEARLAPLLKQQLPGVVSGLHVRSRGERGPVDDIQLAVSPGSAITPKGAALTLESPLYCTWQDLVEEYRDRKQVSDASGVFYLTLHQSQLHIDPPNVDPCQRTAFDPTRDTRLVTLASLRLRRLDIDSQKIKTEHPHRLQNTICADRVDLDFARQFPNSVPLALVAINDQNKTTLLWVSEEAGRYESNSASGYLTLLNQTQAALRQLVTLRNEGSNHQLTLKKFLDKHLQLDYLPASGQLPLSWLEDIASKKPKMHGLPAYLGVDVIPVAADGIDELVFRHLPRRVIDLTQPAGDRIRLLLAMKRSVYKPDLLDIPGLDKQLETDLYRYCQKAYMRWYDWKEVFYSLYYIAPKSDSKYDNELSAEDVKSLNLPEPAKSPLLPDALFNRLIAAAMNRFALEDSENAPYPYDRTEFEIPEFFDKWAPEIDEERMPPIPERPDKHGLIGQYAITEKDLDTTEEKIRDERKKLEATRDILLLKRQQLDSQTVALAALAGGVAGDGKGMQVARWLPYASLNTDKLPTEKSSIATSVATSSTSSVKVATDSKTTADTQYRIAEREMLSLEEQKKRELLGTRDYQYTEAIKGTTYTKIEPDKYSAFELTLNKDRIDRLQIPTASVSKPAFNAKEFSFGVMDHISPDINEYKKIYSGMRDLLTTVLDIFEEPDATDLHTKLTNLSTELISPSDLETEITSETDTEYATLPTEGKPTKAHFGNLIANQRRYEAIFTAGKILTRWISVVENQYNGSEQALQALLRTQKELIATQEKRKAEIVRTRQTLRQLDSIADEALGDYTVAQQLINEDWQRVYEEYRERAHILTTQVEGLYYVRVRQAEISRPLADPLPLRRDNPEDLVPGCSADDDADLAEALLPFWQATLEIPAGHWRAISPFAARLNTQPNIDYLAQLRQVRMTKAYPELPVLKAKAATAYANAAMRSIEDSPAFVELAANSKKRVQRWASLPLPMTGFIPAHKVAEVLSLEDLNNHSHRILRRASRTLQEKLEQCQLCLQKVLGSLPGSIRLRWGQLAEDNRLPVEAISRWPGLKKAEELDFNTTRTLAELIEWWFKQLGENADSDSRQAMRDMVRAAVIYASLGNPQEIVKGSIFSPPRHIAYGERFSVSLNQIVRVGKTLQLLNKEQEVAAELTIEEHDESSTRVKITKVLREDIDFKDNITVIGRVR